VPVYDAAAVLLGRSSSARFYLIARPHRDHPSDLGAIPVNGECQLASGELFSPGADHPGWLAGRLLVGDESVDVVDFGALAAGSERAGDPTPSGEPWS
jgi:hypothetical protein